MRKQITTTIDKDILMKTRILGVQEDLNLNDIIENSLELWLTLKESISPSEIDDLMKVYNRLPSDGIGNEIKKLLMMRMESIRELDDFIEKN